MATAQLPDALARVIASCQAELQELYAVVHQEQRKKLQRWQDEEPMLECQIEALTGTRDIIQREQKQLTAELANLKAFLEKQAAEVAQQGGGSEAGLAADDEAQRQQQLQDLTAKIAELDEELTGLVPKLSGAAGAAGCRPDELSYYETKLVVIQDTRRLLQSEATALSAEIKRRQAAARLAADRQTAAQLGLGDLGRLGERLAGVEAALDRAKVERYFPAQRGFRFSGGGGGVYCGVKDLHLSEVSGAFSVALEAVPAAGGSSSSSGSGQREVRLKVTLSGIATGTSSQEYKQQQQQQKQQQAAKAAAQAKLLKREQAYQQQQQQQGSPLRRSSAAQQQQPGPDSPIKQQQGGVAAGSPLRGGFGGSGGGGSGSSGGGGNRRNAAIAKFLGQLNEKKDALSSAIKTSPLSKELAGLGGSGQPRGQNPSGASPGAGFSRHLAGTFGDKAAGFSQRREQQAAAAAGGDGGDGSGADQGLLGGLAGLGIAAGSSGDLQQQVQQQQGSSCAGSTGSSSVTAPPSSSTDGGGGSSSAASVPASADAADAADAAHSGTGSSARSPAVGAAAAADGLQQGGSPSTTGQQISLQSRADSTGSTGSGNWSLPDRQQQQQQDGQLKAKFGNMKGRLGGLLAESKQKLADSTQKLADSKLVQESRQKLADSKQKLADSKFVAESRAAAKHLLEDSKHLIEESKAGLKKGLSNLQQQQQSPSQGVTPRSSIDRQQQQVQQQQQRELPSQAGTSQQGSTPQQGSSIPQQQQQQQPESGPPSVVLQTSVDAAGDAQQQQQQPAQEMSQPTTPSGQPAPADSTPAAGSLSHTAAAAAAASSAGAPAAAATAAATFPGVAAASAAAASRGQLDQQVLDEAWVGDGQGGLLGGVAGVSGSSASSGSGWLPGVSGAAAAAGAAAGVAGGKGSGSRKGVVVMLLAEGLEILGEKGTKVPNIRAARLGLEVECVLTACLTYSSTLGWQSAGLSFEVVSLERVVEGSNIPVPKTLIKSVLNLVMPSVFTKLLLTSLPHELGQFILDSAATSAAAAAGGSTPNPRNTPSSGTHTAAAAAVAAAGGAGVWLSGELCLSGPPLACLSACLTRSAEEVPAGRVSLTSFVQELRAAQKARALLNLPDPLHSRALALLFTPGSPFCLLDATSSSTAAAAAAGGSNAAAAAAAATAAAGSSVLGVPASLSLREMCRFYLDHSDSSVWGEVCEMWQVAVDAVCLHLTREEGLLLPAEAEAVAPPPAAAAEAPADLAGSSSNSSSGGGLSVRQRPAASVSANSTASSSTPAAAAQGQGQEQFSFSFEGLFNGRVAGLVRKPVRLSFGLHRLLLGLDAAAGLAAARDYCERAAREFAEQAKGEDALLLLQRPLAQQVELLHLWHAALSTYLCSFLQQFKGAGGRIMVAADKGTFSIAVEDLSYEGRLRLQVPLPLLADLATGACNFDLSLPNPEFAVSGIANKLRFISSAISKAAFGKCDEECAATRHVAAVAEAVRSGTDLPLTMMEELEALLTIWNAGAPNRDNNQPAPPAAAAGRTANPLAAPNGSSSGSSGIRLSRASSNAPRSSSSTAAAAAAATASITRNSLMHTPSRRTSSMNAAPASASSSPGAAGAGAAAPIKDNSSDAAAAADGGVGNVQDAAAAGGVRSSSGGAGGPSPRGMIGRICLTKASAGLVLDEKRLKELMAGGAVQDAGLIGGLLGCFGQLFTATVAPGWPASAQQDSLLAASLDSASGSVRDGGGGDGNDNNASSAPQAIVTLRNNEVTRVKVNLDAASFESAVSPRIAVRLLHMLVLAVAHKFGSGSSKRLEIIHKVFTHVAEYLGRDCLDLLVCVDVAAAAVEPAATPAAGNSSSSSSAALQQQEPALQLLLAGAAPGSAGAAAAGPTGGSSGSAGSSRGAGGGSGGGACCYIINDVNLLTVLETVRLLMDYSS